MSAATAREIAEAAGLVKSSIIRRAEKEGWPFEEVAQRGGRQRHYPLDALPVELQASVRKHRGLQAAKRAAVKTVDQMREKDLQVIEARAEAFGQVAQETSASETRARQRRKEDGLAQFNALADGDKKQRALARQYLIQIYWEHYRRVGGTRDAARAAIVDLINTGAIEVAPQFIEYLPQYQGTRTLTAATLHRWELTYLEEGIFGLVDKHGHRKGKSVIETTPELNKVVLACMVRHPHITAKKIKQYLQAEFSHLNTVSEKTIQRFKSGWVKENHQLWTYITNPDRWKNIYMAAVGSHHENITELNQLWEMDSTPADWMLTDGRHSVVGAIDLYSRRLKFRVSRTSSAAAVCQTFRAAALDWGLPKAVRTDNGRDYVSVQFNGVLDSLEIQHELCLPFASEEKGTIERGMRTMSHGILDLLPGFIGHNVAQRKLIEARKSFSDRIMKKGEVIEVALSAAELQQRLDQWCEHLYGKDPHSGLDGRTPWEVANAWLKPIRRVTNERALDALLAPVDGVRVIGKKGITLNHYEYYSGDLFEHVGESAVLKLDEQDIGRVYVYVNEKFVCVAECPELLGISRQEGASATKHKQKKFMREQQAELKEFTRGIAEDMVGAVIQYRIDTSANVTELPKRSEEYSTEALEEAARAIRPAENSPAEVIQTANLYTLNLPVASDHQQRLEGGDACEMYLYWTELEQRAAGGECLSDEQQSWFESFPRSTLFGAGKVVAGMRQQTA